MKNIIIISISIIYIAITGCNYSPRFELKNEVISLGDSSHMRLIRFYDVMDKQQYFSERNKELLSALYKTIDTASFADLHKNVFDSANIRKNVILFLDSVYKGMDQTDNEFNGEIRKGFQSLLIRYTKKLQEFPSIPDSLFRKIPVLEQEINNLIKGKRVLHPDDWNYEFLGILRQIWLEDTKIIFKHIDAVFSEDFKRIDQLPLAVFHEEKIRELIKEPYADKQVLVELYKNILKKDLAKDKDKVVNQVKEISYAFTEMSTLNFKLSDDKIGKMELRKRIVGIDTLLSK